LVRAQEARLHEVMEVRNAVLNKAREQAAAKVAAARAALQKDVEVAKASLQVDADRLSQDVIATILRPVAMAQSPAGGAQ